MNRVRVVVAEAWRSLSASVATTLAATMTVLIGMFLVGLLIGLGTWARSWADNQKDQLLVEAFFCTDSTCRTQKPPRGEATPAEINALRARLEASPLVDEVEFVSKEEALNIMEKRAPELVEQLPGNPLPASFRITPQRGEDVGRLAASLEPVPAGVEKVDFGKKTASRVLKVARIFEILSVLGILILIGSATILIGNTIRLSIFARRREIEVMKLVGASNWFVRGPFIVEGLFCGLAGAAAAVVLLFLGKELVLPQTIGRLDADGVEALAFGLNALILLGLGLLLGAVGSALTIRRFLHV